MARRAQGDHDSFGALFRRHANAVANHCFRRTASWSTAEDLTSVVFMETWRRRRVVQLPEGGSLLPWLLTVANNVSRNSRRSHRRHMHVLNRLPTYDVEPDPADLVAAKTDAERQMSRVLIYLQQLDPQEQDLITMCAWSKLTYAEAGAALGLPVTTVRSRLAHARTRLRELVERDDEHPAEDQMTRRTPMRREPL